MVRNVFCETGNKCFITKYQQLKSTQHIYPNLTGMQLQLS